LRYKLGDISALPWNPQSTGKPRQTQIHYQEPAIKMSSPDLSALKIDDHHRITERKSKLGWIVAIVLLLIIAGGALFAFRPKVDAVEVMTVHASSANTPSTLLNASGYVTPRRRSTIAAKITARVTNIFTDEGMRVSAGQVLAKLDDSDARVRLNSAKADVESAKAQLADLQVNLANAETELNRSEQLVKGGVSTQQNLDLARTTVNSYKARIVSTRVQVTAAERRVDVAQQDVDNCTVRSPYAGLIVSKDAQVGEMVSPISAGGGFTRTGIATIVDMNSLEIEVDVNESYIARVKNGQPRQRSSRRISRLDDSFNGSDDHSDRRPTEGDGQSTYLIQSTRSAHPPRHGSQGFVPPATGTRGQKNKSDVHS
jgi:HlyD family secretion protein